MRAVRGLLRRWIDVHGGGIAGLHFGAGDCAGV